MAVPITPETRCKDESVQARLAIRSAPLDIKSDWSVHSNGPNFTTYGVLFKRKLMTQSLLREKGLPLHKECYINSGFHGKATLEHQHSKNVRKSTVHILYKWRVFLPSANIVNSKTVYITVTAIEIQEHPVVLWLTS